MFCHGWLFADHEFDFRYEIDYHLSIDTRRLKRGVPAADLFFAWLLTGIWRTSIWECRARVAHGTSRLYWSNLPAAKSPRGGTGTF
jgi:hypothetical protein